MTLRCEQCGWEVETDRPLAEWPICGRCDAPWSRSNARLKPVERPRR